ncbi:MAG TPA: 16S rRNA (guanine(966)-N(2))-methyltransferase RsmD [Anaerolineales bacterium]|nr:16S rRNA (guanine(966)-N(2))-methyltransferase RsmD [Anaerolineales bacterium]
MRVVAGLAKGRILKAVPGAATRPISDRVKVALFDILAPEISGASLLDLFSGTGAVGIEALSRGAARAVFVDREPVAIRVIHENLKITGLSAGAQVVRADAFSYLERRGVPAFDIIYIAPPQYRGMWREALQLVDRRPDWLVPDGLAIVQLDPREFEEVGLSVLREADRRRYGSTLLVFYERPGS